MKSEENTFEFNNWIYTCRIFGSDIDYGKTGQKLEFELELDTPDYNEIPKTLTKHYSVDKYSVKSLLNRELYASHPRQLNDLYDCYHGFIDFSGMRLEDYLTYFKALKSEDEVRYLYEHDIKKLQFELSLYNATFTYCRIGTISMTEIDNDMCMWAHYSDSHKGFAIKFNTNQIENKFYGPFPVHYVDNYKRIDILKYGFILSFFYQSSLKSTKWIYEKEWRLLGEKEEMIIPGLHEPPNANDRCFQFDKSAIKEIILGFKFFEGIIAHRINNSTRYRLLFNDKNNLKYILLKEIYENYNDCLLLVELDNDNQFELIKLKIQIETINGLEIIVNYAT